MTPKQYIEEPASNPPKEKGVYTCKNSEGCKDVFFDPNGHFGAFVFRGFKSWLRPLTQQEVDKEMGEFAEWAAINNWRLTDDNNSVWKRPRMLNPIPEEKTTEQLIAEFREWKQSQTAEK